MTSTPNPNEHEELSIEEAFEKFKNTVEDAVEEFKTERLDLFDGEQFETEGHNYGDDLRAYDQTAYTQTHPKNSQQLDFYRYNLQAASDQKGGNSSWYNSWYSGYTTTESALTAVHRSVCTQITLSEYKRLKITNDLDRPNILGKISGDIAINATADPYNRSIAVDNNMIVRIDSSLYKTLGLEEAQQHYVVDGIAQVMAIQNMPYPEFASYLQSDLSSEVTALINIQLEVITEILRHKGLEYIVEEMPGWMKRVTALRAAMYVEEPPEGDIPAAFLLYAVWERDVISSETHKKAIEAIEAIEHILFDDFYYSEPEEINCKQIDSSLSILNDCRLMAIRSISNVDGISRLNKEKLSQSYKSTIKSINQYLCSRQTKIQEILFDYVMDGLPMGKIIEKLKYVKKRITSWIHDYGNTPLVLSNRIQDFVNVSKCPVEDRVPEAVVNVCSQLTESDRQDLNILPSKTIVDEITGPGGFNGLMDLIHEHNNTFQYSPKLIRSNDHPSCSNKTLLPDVDRVRVELSRKTQFSIEKVTNIISDSEKNKELLCAKAKAESVVLGPVRECEKLIDSLLEEFESKLSKKIKERVQSVLEKSKIKKSEEEKDRESIIELSSHHTELVHDGMILNNIIRGSSENIEYASRKRVLYNIEEESISRLKNLIDD